MGKATFRFPYRVDVLQDVLRMLYDGVDHVSRLSISHVTNRFLPTGNHSYTEKGRSVTRFDGTLRVEVPAGERELARKLEEYAQGCR